ncbi:MAG: hypothetical protein HC897_01270 [Thermoanaerobaculia bacterium]|nr:hypothetical protein [Thermoanaerobaculia bacterium]
MNGYRSVLPDLVTWMQHGVSLLRHSSLEVVEGRVCQFSKALGEIDGATAGECREGITQPLPSYTAQSDTNLHLAILSAMDYDLTLIVTDGVAATGGEGIEDCASGVDAGCIARSLRRVLESRQRVAETADWGLWVLPMIAPFDGWYYTEQKIELAAFVPEGAITRVLEETGSEPQIGTGERIQDGTLRFAYKGPRAFLLLVLARQSTTGRAMVQALWDRTSSAGIPTIASLKEYKGRPSLLPPLEVFPGFVDTVSWTKLDASREIPTRGTIDASLVGASGGGAPQIRIGCPPGEAGEGYFTLRGDSQLTTRVAGCVGIQLVPAVQMALQPQRAERAPEMPTLLASYRPASEGMPALDLHLTCGPRSVTSCQEPLELGWRAEMHYGPAADCLADGSCSSGAIPAIRGLSTLELSQYPHRIFGIDETIKELLRLMSSEVPVQTIANLGICRSEL